MKAVFADTFFYLALLNEEDTAHSRAVAVSRVNRPIVTTEFVALELGNACARASDHTDFLALSPNRTWFRTACRATDAAGIRMGGDFVPPADNLAPL
jgi:hypothetical protein